MPYRCRQAGAVEHRAHLPVVAELGEDFRGRVGRQQIDRDTLADPVDRAIGLATDRGAIDGTVGGNEEALVVRVWRYISPANGRVSGSAVRATSANAIAGRLPCCESNH